MFLTLSEVHVSLAGMGSGGKGVPSEQTTSEERRREFCTQSRKLSKARRLIVRQDLFRPEAHLAETFARLIDHLFRAANQRHRRFQMGQHVV